MVTVKRISIGDRGSRASFRQTFRRPFCRRDERVYARPRPPFATRTAPLQPQSRARTTDNCIICRRRCHYYYIFRYGRARVRVRVRRVSALHSVKRARRRTNGRIIYNEQSVHVLISIGRRVLSTDGRRRAASFSPRTSRTNHARDPRRPKCENAFRPRPLHVTPSVKKTVRKSRRPRENAKCACFSFFFSDASKNRKIPRTKRISKKYSPLMIGKRVYVVAGPFSFSSPG